MAYDGTITIGTQLATDKFDKQIVDLEKKVRKEEEKAKIKLDAKLQAEDELKKHRQAIFEIEKEYERTSQEVERLQSLMSKQSKGISLTPQEFMDLQGSREMIANNEKIGSTLDRMYEKEVKLNNTVDKTALAYKQIQDNVTEYKAKIESIKLQKQQVQVNDIKKGFDNIGKSIKTSIGQIGRLALGVLSIASAYRLVSQASSTLGQYDEQYATNLEYLRYLLAQVLAPALKYLVNLASTLLSYLNYILNTWFSITLFSKNSAKNFANAKNSTSGISKNTGKIKKDLQTTPFDEMNVLSDTTSSAGGGTTGGGGAIMPSIDPSLFEGKVPDWLQWIVDHKNEILATMAGIAGGLALWKLGLSGIKSLGIGMMITGIIYTIEALLDYLKNPSWENFGKIVIGIGVAITGLGIAFLGLPAIVTGVIVLILGIIIKYWDKIKAFLDKIIDWLESQIDNVYDKFGNIIGGIYTFLVGAVEDGVRSFDGLLKGLKNVLDGMIKLVKGVFKGDWKMAWEGIKQIFKGVFQSLWSIAKLPLNLIISGLNALIRGANRIRFDVPDWVPGLGGKQFGFNIPQIPKLAVGAIINNPGRGIPVGGGSAIAGEAGREGILPLTDSQAMEILGEAIGRYVTINANIINSMNGRVLSRQLQKIQNNSNFAYNN